MYIFVFQLFVYKKYILLRNRLIVVIVEAWIDIELQIPRVAQGFLGTGETCGCSSIFVVDFTFVI